MNSDSPFRLKASAIRPMNHPTNNESSVQHATQSFAMGVVVMMFFNVAQRLIGLGRNFGFCQFLSDAELGHWALANSFFLIAAPFAVLGLPGSFGKFVEHFRARGCLGDYVWRILAGSAIGMLLLVMAMLSFPETFAWTIYGESFAEGWQAGLGLIAWTAWTFLTVTAFNIVYELAVAMRLIRTASLMQFLQSAGFALLGITVLAWQRSWVLLLPAYAVACLIAIVPGVYSIYYQSQGVLKPTKTLSHRMMWARILPFAAALWLTNLLTNSFELVDRYMLLHFCKGGEEVGQALVGQFYCGRILPNLLLSLALMMSGMLLPYLSADWESQRRDRIADRMRQVLASVSLAFSAISIGALLFAPVLFQYVLRGRYSEAHEILAIALSQCTWSSLSLLASTYLLCAEKGKQASLVLAFGVVINVGLNVPLIQSMGLYGSLLATWLANGIVLSLTLWRINAEGCKVGWKTLLLCLAPALIIFGEIPAALGLCGIFVLAGRTNWILSSQDRREIDEFILPRLNKFGIQLPSLWPTV